VKLSDGDVLVAGGSTSTTTPTLSEIYNPSTNTWTQTGSLNEPRSDGRGVLLDNGDVVFAGGYVIYNQSSPSIQYLHTSELYNVTTSKWTLTGDLSSAMGEMGDATVPQQRRRPRPWRELPA
jgi:N-acetylneuraminic acid mutarotase